MPSRPHPEVGRDHRSRDVRNGSVRRGPDHNLESSGGIEFGQQLVGSPHVRNHYASSYHQRDVDRIFLLGAGHTQAIGLYHVVVDAIVATQTGGSNQPHQFLVFRGQRAFEVGVVVEVVEAFDEEVVGLVNILIQTSAGVEKTPGEFA